MWISFSRTTWVSESWDTMWVTTSCDNTWTTVSGNIFKIVEWQFFKTPEEVADANRDNKNLEF